ncbi:MAG: pilus assembly PilX family protein [Lysobacteraceae bacterium]
MRKLPRPPRRQQGVALVIALVLLLVMSVLGVSSLKTSMMQERMSGAAFDRGLAFQAAEAALREGEALLVGPVPPAIPANGCLGGLCARPVPAQGVPDRWADPTFAGWADGTTPLGGLIEGQQYFVEDMGPAPNWPGCEQEIPVNALCLSPRYRITARSGDETQARSRVVLQSSFATP